MLNIFHEDDRTGVRYDGFHTDVRRIETIGKDRIGRQEEKEKK